MGTTTNNEVAATRSQIDIPADAARGYIIEMLAELCAVAQQSEQEDLHLLLKLVFQAMQDTKTA